MERLQVAGGAMVLLLVALACKSSSSVTVAPATEDAAADSAAALSARKLCERLVGAGVAKNCGVPAHSADLEMMAVTFDVVGGFPDDHGLAFYDESGEHIGAPGDGGCRPNENVLVSNAQYEKEGLLEFCPQPNDYWSLDVNTRSTSTKLAVNWFSGASFAGKFGDDKSRERNAWEKCRALRFGPSERSTPVMVGWTAAKSVTACAKLYPKEYAAYRSLYDAAKAAVNAP